MTSERAASSIPSGQMKTSSVDAGVENLTRRLDTFLLFGRVPSLTPPMISSIWFPMVPVDLTTVPGMCRSESPNLQRTATQPMVVPQQVLPQPVGVPMMSPINVAHQMLQPVPQLQQPAPPMMHPAPHLQQPAPHMMHPAPQFLAPQPVGFPLMMPPMQYLQGPCMMQHPQPTFLQPVPQPQQYVAPQCHFMVPQPSTPVGQVCPPMPFGGYPNMAMSPVPQIATGVVSAQPVPTPSPLAMESTPVKRKSRKRQPIVPDSCPQLLDMKIRKPRKTKQGMKYTFTKIVAQIWLERSENKIRSNRQTKYPRNDPLLLGDLDVTDGVTARQSS